MNRNSCASDYYPLPLAKRSIQLTDDIEYGFVYHRRLSHGKERSRPYAGVKKIDIKKSEDPRAPRVRDAEEEKEREREREERVARPLGLFAVIGGALTRQTKHRLWPP